MGPFGVVIFLCLKLQGSSANLVNCLSLTVANCILSRVCNICCGQYNKILEDCLDITSQLSGVFS